MKAAVVIPVYKDKLSALESISFMQCLKCLQAYPIILCVPFSLSLSRIDEYFNNFPGKKIISRFDDEFFTGIERYNKLLTDISFYKKFREYDFILIHQLDAFVFKDELLYWCKKNYDYIGAPWFKNHSAGLHNEPLWTVGNGGFSLRKVSSFIKCLESRQAFKTKTELYNEYVILPWRNRIKKLPHFLLKIIGIHNTIKDFLKQYSGYEDTFWSIEVAKRRKSFKVAGIATAIPFSFECNPRLLFQLNNYQRPFGCHAWWRYDLEFWKPFVEEAGYHVSVSEK